MEAFLPVLIAFAVVAVLFAVGFWAVFARAVRRDRDSR